MSEMLQLRAWLLDSQPEVWRRLLVDPRLTLEQLHSVLQAAFGWTDSHMHQFHEKNGTRYARPNDFDSDAVDERKVSVGQVFDRKKKRLAYEYDFGDSWMHAVELEKRVEAEEIEYPGETFIKPGKGVFSAKSRAAMCIAGERAGPPEDCGGLYGFFDLMEIKERPSTTWTEDEQERMEWLGDWDPGEFQLAEVNQHLGRVRVKKALAK